MTTLVYAQAQFPQTLKTLRLARHWKQGYLAKRLHVNPRTLISWEAGERLPSVGMVVLLGWLLEEPARPNLLVQSQLLHSYTLDELRRQAQKDVEWRGLAEEALVQLTNATAGEEGRQAGGDKRDVFLLDQLAEQPQIRFELQAGQNAQQEANPGERLQQLFALLEQLQRQPELIPVVQDFLRQLATG